MLKHPFCDGMYVPDEKEFHQHGLLVVPPGHKTTKNYVRNVMHQIDLGTSDLATLTGSSRMYINLIVHEKIVPSVEDAMKIAYVLNFPVEKLFDLTPESWHIHCTDVNEQDATLFYNTVNKRVYNSKSKRKAKSHGVYDYYDIQECKYVKQKEYQQLLRQYKQKHSNKRYIELSNQEDNIWKPSELKRYVAIQLEDEFKKRYIQVFWKIVKPFNPIQLTRKQEVRCNNDGKKRSHPPA